MFDLWDLHQYRQIHSLQTEANRTKQDITETVSGMQEVERRLNKLHLICMALWSLLKEHTDLTEEDLAKRVEAIDMLDGQLDGKVSQKGVKCPKCNRVMSAKHDRCLYCGYVSESGPFGLSIP